MHHSFVRFGAVAAAILLTLTLGHPRDAHAQDVDLTGTWTLTVTSQTGTTTPTLTLDQEGETLTGTYASEQLGEAEVTGTISGSEIEIAFQADFMGQPVPVRYTGTVESEDSFSGNLELAGMPAGTYTAARQEE